MKVFISFLNSFLNSRYTSVSCFNVFQNVLEIWIKNSVSSAQCACMLIHTSTARSYLIRQIFKMTYTDMQMTLKTYLFQNQGKENLWPLCGLHMNSKNVPQISKLGVTLRANLDLSPEYDLWRGRKSRLVWTRRLSGSRWSLRMDGAADHRGSLGRCTLSQLDKSQSHFCKLLCYQ